MKLHALALAAGLVMSSAASATINLNLVDGTNLGNFGAPTTWSESFAVSVAGTIDHSLSFNITTPLYAGSGVSDIPLSFFTVVFKDITGLSADIYKNVGSTSTLYTTFVQNGDPDHLILPANSFFDVGNYTLKVGGISAGTAGAFYSVAAVTVPVPEPETWAMLLAGLGLVGLQLRRKAATLV
ncbi:MAG: FxDxF family PEP-CTERM protein [Thiobacillus sp.]|nr:FxDxF family PEP-CTERM protein [Thiobacillus sp.]